MTDPTPTTTDTPPESAVDAPESVAAPEVAPEGQDGSDDAQAPSTAREAARYRRKLREVEAERDQLVEQVAGHHRATVERAAAAQMSTPADLWLAGVDLADLIGDDGNPDDDKVAAAVEQVLTGRPHWRKTAPASFDGGARTTVPKGDSWAEVLRRH